MKTILVGWKRIKVTEVAEENTGDDIFTLYKGSGTDNFYCKMEDAFEGETRKLSAKNEEEALMEFKELVYGSRN